MFAFLITLLLVSALIAGGIAINMYLYSRGAMGRLQKAGRLAPASVNVSQTFMAEDAYVMSMGLPDASIVKSLRRFIVVFMSLIVVLVFLLSLLMSVGR